jgi:hypothetical protein
MVTQMRAKTWWLLVPAAIVAGCALYSDVVIAPLFLTPATVERGSNLFEMVDTGDFARAVVLARGIDAKERPPVRELAAIGRAELAAGRFPDARRHLRAALDLKPPFQQEAEIAWDLSQTEYLSNNFASSKIWAEHAMSKGMKILPWHLEYLEVLSDVSAYRIPHREATQLPMKFGRPDIPRIDVQANGRTDATAVIDSGAVLSIVSEAFAERAHIRSLGDFKGTFYGLLGEPITVSFGLIDTLRIGGLEVQNVPVAIMPDKKLDFFINNRQPFRMDILLGTNLLKEFRMELNYRNESVTFTPLTDAMRQPVDNQNLFFLGFRPMVHATINKRGWYLFLIDTGSEVTFLNERLLSETNVRNLPKVHGAMLQGLGGAQQHGSKIENVGIGVDAWEGQFKTLPLYGNDTTDALGIVGQNYLRNFRVILDFGSMRLDLKRDRGPFGAL